MYSLNFLKSKWKTIFYIYGVIRIKRRLSMNVPMVLFGRYAKTQMPLHSLFAPILVPFFLSTGPNKKLHFHLLKFTHSENKLPCHNLVPECFSNLCNTKRNFHSAGFLHI